jgi:hypothetical protein
MIFNQKKRITIIFLLTIFMFSCASSGPFTAGSTRRNLDKLEVGMAKSEILNIMGSPYQREVFIGKDGQPVEVLLYQTKFVGLLNPPSDRDLTPVVLKNNYLVGWGRNFYDQSKRYEIKHEIEVK